MSAWLPTHVRSLPARLRPGTRRAIACLLACIAANGQIVRAWEDPLARIEQLASRQPVQAHRELDALLQQRTYSDEPALLRIELIRVLIADAQSRPDDVLAIIARNHDRFRTLDDARMQMLIEHARADAYYELGRPDECWSALQDELKQADRSKDGDLFAQAMIDRARFLIGRSDFEPAAEAIADAERRVSNPQTGAEVAFASANLARAIGDWTMARSAYQAAYAEFSAVADRPGQAEALAGSGDALRQLGRYSEALEPLNSALRLYREVDDKDGAALATQTLALVQAGLNDAVLALHLNAQAIEQLSQLNEPLQLAQARIDRARLLVAQRRAADALPLIEQARSVIGDQGDLRSQGLFHETAASVLSALHRYREANEESAQLLGVERRRVDQLVSHQLAAQRGRLESERLSRENSLLRAEASSSQLALAQANRAAELQDLVLGLIGVVVVGALYAIWRQHGLMRRIARMAQTDALTGVLSRRHVLELGQRMMQRCRRDGRPCAMLMLDVDRFKEINDRYGHLAGDTALRAISAALTRCLRPEDQIGRYGGEEFAVILPGADAKEAGAIAERLRTAVQTLKPDWAPGAQSLTVSGGIAIATEEIADFTELLGRADQALYRAKDAGRNRMEYHKGGPVLAAG
ncbi:MAG TPA: tetratricopeptide repeat-containing diguanylate cyclase [Burkholderiaceae bacterium]|nr:tetratricopeptide repeat-containing diguanylate cyclase [Burkholderiaceae bacterium]